MASFDGALRKFVEQFGEDSVEVALDMYGSHKERSKKAAAKTRAQKQGLQNLLSQAKSNPQLAETLRKAGIQIGQ